MKYRDNKNIATEIILYSFYKQKYLDIKKVLLFHQFLYLNQYHKCLAVSEALAFC